MSISLIPEVEIDGKTNTYKEDTLMEGALAIIDRETDAIIRAKILSTIKSKVTDYDGDFVYVTRSGRRNNLTRSASQKLYPHPLLIIERISFFSCCTHLAYL